MRIALVTILIFTNLISFAVALSEDELSKEARDNHYCISTALVVPLNGTLYISWGRSVSDRVVLSNYLAYFNREWMLLLEKGDWTSRSAYFGIMLQYFPFCKKNEYSGYFIGGDTGLATSRQTYYPVNKSDIFFFNYIEFYYLGYRIPLNMIHKRLKLDVTLGGGWAPVSHEVNIEGHRNEGDFYPLADIRLSYLW